MNLDLAGLDGRLVKEGEEMDVEEEAGAAMLLEEDSTPHCESQLVPCNTLSTPTISNDLVPRWALDEEGYTPQIGDGHPWATSCGELVANTMRHMHCLHDVLRSLSLHSSMTPSHPHVQGSVTQLRRQREAHRAPWSRPGTITKKQDTHLASAAQLKGQELLIMGTGRVQREAAALGTPYLSTHPQHRSQPQSWTVRPHWPNR